MLRILSCLGICFAMATGAAAHDLGEPHGHAYPTFQFTAPVKNLKGEPHLSLTIIDAATGKPTPARFTLRVDGASYVPEKLGVGGLRFVSIHKAKKQSFTVTYARGRGEVEVPLPPDVKRVEVTAVKGFDYRPVSKAADVVDGSCALRMELRRWTDIQQRGWLPTDEHLHYERLKASLDSEWLTMLAADDLAMAHFMVLKGGNLPGVWAQQFAYGKKGEGGDGQRLLRPGEEHRDSFQGHINLLGINKIIHPISTGGIGSPPVPFNYPPLHDVFLQTRRLGGIGGVAHGGALGRSHTGVVDTVLGAVDFFEIANTHLYKTDVWYRLMNCGFLVPPAAGTDLPNFPFRDAWQPFLGEVRMYVKVGKRRDFESWKQAVRRGEVFITSGPILQFRVGGVGPGGTLRLPEGGDMVDLESELASPLELQTHEIVQGGQVLPGEVVKTRSDGIHRWRIRRRLRVTQRCWLAARGVGAPKHALKKGIGIDQPVIAHTAAVRIEVGGRPITSPTESQFLMRQLADQQQYYRTKGQYDRNEHRARMMALFDKAIRRLEPQAR